MLRISMTLPPNLLGAVGGDGIEGQLAVFYRMPFLGENGTSKTEGRNRASLSRSST